MAAEERYHERDNYLSCDDEGWTSCQHCGSYLYEEGEFPDADSDSEASDDVSA